VTPRGQRSWCPRFSARITSQPAALSAASWIERSWSVVPTRAYPMMVMATPHCFVWLYPIDTKLPRQKGVTNEQHPLGHPAAEWFFILVANLKNRILFIEN
jgi:hypothetical protein